MGRELKRVPMGFDWELNKTWEGYLNPHKSWQCIVCEGTGYNQQTLALHKAWYSFNKAEWIWVDEDHTRRYNTLAWQNNLDQDDVIALVNTGRLMDFTHNWTRESGWVKKEPPYTPTAEEVNEWNKHGMGHDSVNCWVCVEAKAHRLGVWGKCPICEGEGKVFESPEIKKAFEGWAPTKPPAGDGYQLWETTSEGSPISPVFATLDELCEWASEHTSTFGRHHTTASEWKRMLGDGLVYHREGNAVFI